MTSVGVILFCFDVTVVCHLFCIFHSWENKSIRILSHLVILGLSETNDNFAHISENVLNNTALAKLYILAKLFLYYLTYRIVKLYSYNVSLKVLSDLSKSKQTSLIKC